MNEAVSAFLCQADLLFTQTHAFRACTKTHGRNLVLTPRSVHTQKGAFGGLLIVTDKLFPTGPLPTSAA